MGRSSRARTFASLRGALPSPLQTALGDVAPDAPPAKSLTFGCLQEANALLRKGRSHLCGEALYGDRKMSVHGPMARNAPAFLLETGRAIPVSTAAQVSESGRVFFLAKTKPDAVPQREEVAIYWNGLGISSDGIMTKQFDVCEPWAVPAALRVIPSRTSNVAPSPPILDSGLQGAAIDAHILRVPHEPRGFRLRRGKRAGEHGH